MKIQGSRFYRNGLEENAEQSSLTDVRLRSRSRPRDAVAGPVL